MGNTTTGSQNVGAKINSITLIASTPKLWLYLILRGLEKGWKLQKILIILKNVLNESCVRLNFPQKNSLDAYFYLPQQWSLGGSKDLRFWNIIMHWNENVLQIYLKTQGIASCSKNFYEDQKIWHLSVISRSLFLDKHWYFFPHLF